MTITQKILASKLGREIHAGELIEVEVDLILANDITAPVAINELENAGLGMSAPDRTVFVLDHFTPCRDIKSAQNCAQIREFCKKHGVKWLYDVGEMGIEHVLLPEQGHVAPGELIIGADSHTCTYGALGAFSTGVGSTDAAYAMATGKAWFKIPSAIKFEVAGKLKKWVSGKDVILDIISRTGVDGARYASMEFTGDLSGLNIDDRFTIANMSIEAGAKNAVFEVDEITKEYLSGRVDRSFSVFTADSDARYEKTIKVGLDSLEPLVACPHLPSNVRPARELTGTHVDQVVIGSCTNGRLSDLRVAAEIMRGRKVAKGTRCIVIPATQRIYLEGLEYIRILLEAGAVVSAPTCGPCLGGHMGVLADGETAISTTNRNFVGRMGHKTSKIYLSGSAVAAESAIAGEIAVPN